VITFELETWRVVVMGVCSVIALVCFTMAAYYRGRRSVWKKALEVLERAEQETKQWKADMDRLYKIEKRLNENT